MFAEAFLCSRSKTVSGNGVRCLSHAQMWCYGSVVDSNSAFKKNIELLRGFLSRWDKLTLMQAQVQTVDVRRRMETGGVPLSSQ